MTGVELHRKLSEILGRAVYPNEIAKFFYHTKFNGEHEHYSEDKIYKMFKSNRELNSKDIEVIADGLHIPIGRLYGLNLLKVDNGNLPSIREKNVELTQKVDELKKLIMQYKNACEREVLFNRLLIEKLNSLKNKRGGGKKTILIK